MNTQQLTPEQNYQVLLDALKYTSDIVVTLTEKNSINENKIAELEKNIKEQKYLIGKNNKSFEELEKKLIGVEKNIIGSVNRDLLLIKNNKKSNIELLSKTNSNTKNNLTSRIEVEDGMDLQEELDLETINNTICNTGLLSDVTSFNLEEVDKIKKQKAATSLVETLIRKKQELENKINDLTSNQDNKSNQSNQSNQDNKSKELATVIIGKDNKSKVHNDITIEESKDNKIIDLNAIRRKKNFARKF
jgi:hypothetical protein